MGSTHTTNATARTSITLATGVDMNKLLEELAADFEARRPPEDAITVRAFAEGVGCGRTMARTELERLVNEDGWTTSIFGGTRYFWKSAD